jgi:recombination protein RecA
VKGSRVRVKVVKNKMAPPFKQAEFDVMFAEGISKVGELVDVGVERRIVDKAGAWYSYKEERLGQGREAVKTFLQSNPDVAEAISTQIRQSFGLIDKPGEEQPSTTTRTDSKKPAGAKS